MPISLPEKPEDDDKEFGLLSEGFYDMRVKDLTVETTKSGKNEGAQYLKMTAEVTEDGEYKGRLVWDNISLLPSYRWKLNDIFSSITGDDWEGKTSFETYEIIGNSFVGEVFIDNYTDAAGNKKQSNKIKNYLPKKNEDGGSSLGFGS